MSDLTHQLPYYLALDSHQVDTLALALEEAIASFDSRASDYQSMGNTEMRDELEGRAADVSYLLTHLIGSTDDSSYPADTEVAA